MPVILVADDDGHIREVVRYALEKGGFNVLEASDGTEASGLMDRETVDLAILDIVMPGEDGIQVSRGIQGRIPVIFLTSRSEEVDRVLGLELGADDYVTKPFSPRELVARVRAVLRRTGARADQGDAGVLRRGMLELDPTRHRCSAGGVEVELTATEFAMLGALMGVPGKVFSRSELVTRSYDDGRHVTDRTVDSHVRRIRKKLCDASGDEHIETVHGVGYRLAERENG